MTKERGMCLYCKYRVVNSPRGLCWTCQRDPQIRVQYGFDDHDEDVDAIAKAIPLSRGDSLPDPPPYVEVAPKPGIGSWNGQWSGAYQGRLTADTSPRAIARRQRNDVAECLRRGITDLEEISAIVILPKWIVGRRIEELQGVTKS